MSEFVLIAVPYRNGTSGQFVQNCRRVFRQQTHKTKELALFPNNLKPDGRKYGTHAQARNLLIDCYLRPEHTHVLWLDVDLVNVPDNLIDKLLAVDASAIVAPFVFTEKLDKAAPASMTNGGWFYDTGGFKRLNGSYAMPFFPHFNGENEQVMEMESVGCCYLAPAQLYRDGCHYEPNALDVEHLSFCKQARERGTRIFADSRLKVEHAFLPKYGEAWHG